MLIYPTPEIKLAPFLSGTSTTGGSGGFFSGGLPPYVNHISSPSGTYNLVNTDNVVFYQANHAVDMNNATSAPSFSFQTSEPFYVGMIGASGSIGLNTSPGLGGIGVALVTPASNTTFTVWSGVGGYQAMDRTTQVSVAIGGGAGGLGGSSPGYHRNNGGGGMGALVVGTGAPTTSNILAMVGSGGGSGNAGPFAHGPGGSGGGFNRPGTERQPGPTPGNNAQGKAGTTSAGGAGSSDPQPYAANGSSGSQFQGGSGGPGSYDGGSGGGSGWYGGGGGSGGGGYSGQSGGGGSGKIQSVSGHTVDISPSLTQTADGSISANATLQSYIRSASNTTYSIPNGALGYGMAPYDGTQDIRGHSGWAVVWSYHQV